MSTLVIETYNPDWPRQFRVISSRFSSMIGTCAAAIEHVGSTAVPGLAAKPIIDIDVLLRSSFELPEVIGKFAAFGYEHRGDLGVPQREAFRSPADLSPHHLYVCPPGSAAFHAHLLFRDFLRLHPERAAAYAELKRELAALHPDDRSAYAHGKTVFIEETLKVALSGGL